MKVDSHEELYLEKQKFERGREKFNIMHLMK